MRRIDLVVGIALGLVAMGLSTVAAAEKPPVVRVRHVPLMSARADGGDLVVSARIERDWAARQVRLHYRSMGQKRYRSTELRKDRSGRFVAVVPGGAVARPGFEYFLASKTPRGKMVEHFASASRPHRVYVEGASAAQREAIRLRRHQGTRYDFSLGFRRVAAGRREVAGQEYPDGYNQLDLSFRYRLLSDFIYAIGFDFGILGAKLGTTRPPRQIGNAVVLPQETGVYFGRARATWEFADLFGVDLAVIFGANQSGFVLGGGGTFRLGRVTGTHLDIGAEYIQATGYDFWMEFAWDTVPRVQMSLRADLTSYPSGTDGMAVIPSFNVTWSTTRNLYIRGSIGYGTRSGYQRGGLNGGGAVGYRF